MRVISDLDRDRLAPACKILQTVVAPAPFLDLPEAAENLPLRVENRRLIAAPLQRRVPRCKQRIAGFHHLRGTPSAATVPALFPL